MTKQEFLKDRQRMPWMNWHALTVKCIYVCGVKRMQVPSRKNQMCIVGRVLWFSDCEDKADYADWNLNGVALGHDYGNLDMETVNL